MLTLMAHCQFPNLEQSSTPPDICRNRYHFLERTKDIPLERSFNTYSSGMLGML